MYYVYSHMDSSRIGLLNGILNDAGILTILKNWTGSNILEVPIPSLYPSIYVLDRDRVEEAIEMINEYLNNKPASGEAWACLKCNNIVDAELSECWYCQADKPSCS